MIAEPRKIKKRGSFRTLLFSVFLIAFILGISVFLISSNIGVGQKKSQLFEKLKSLEKEIQKIQEKNKELKQQSSESSQESFIEKEARERLNLKKPGENVVVILPPKEEKQEIKEQKSLWQRILDMLKSW